MVDPFQKIYELFLFLFREALIHLRIHQIEIFSAVLHQFLALFSEKDIFNPVVALLGCTDNVLFFFQIFQRNCYGGR